MVGTLFPGFCGNALHDGGSLRAVVDDQCPGELKSEAVKQLLKLSFLRLQMYPVIRIGTVLIVEQFGVCRPVEEEGSPVHKYDPAVFQVIEGIPDAYYAVESDTVRSVYLPSALMVIIISGIRYFYHSVFPVRLSPFLFNTSLFLLSGAEKVKYTAEKTIELSAGWLNICFIKSR